MATFVINEWLPEDAAGVNGLHNQQDALKIISSLATSNHQIVIVQQSACERKFYALCANNYDIAVRGIAKTYMLELRGDQNRCRILIPGEVAEVPADLLVATKQDDHYLLQAQQTVLGAIVVTTDTPLRNAISRAGFPCLSREQFIADFF